MIICGYAGTGKSTAAKKFVGVVDLESTPFQKDWETYARVAKHMSDQGYVVLVSCHNELRETLFKENIEYLVVYPGMDQKEEYQKRYEGRGNSEAFIRMQMSHWSEWVGACVWKKTVGDGTMIRESMVFLTTTPSGHVETMTDFLDDILRYGEGCAIRVRQSGYKDESELLSR